MAILKDTLLKKALKSPNFQPFPFKNPYMPVILPSIFKRRLKIGKRYVHAPGLLSFFLR